jgi:hypothetical protein
LGIGRLARRKANMTQKWMPEGKPEKQEVELAVLLSVTTGCLLVETDEFPKLVSLMSFVKQETLIHTDEDGNATESQEVVLPRLSKVSQEIAPWLNEQLPAIRELGAPPQKGWRTWLAKAEGKVGKVVEVKPLPLSRVGWMAPEEDWKLIK